MIPTSPPRGLVSRVVSSRASWLLAACAFLGCDGGDVALPDTSDAAPPDTLDAALPDTLDAALPDAALPDAPDGRPADGGAADADPRDVGPLPEAVPLPPLDEAVGVIHGWAASGAQAYARLYPLPGGGALAVFVTYAPLALPLVDGAFEHPGPPAGEVDVLLAWLDGDGRITDVRHMMRHRGGDDLSGDWTLGRDRLAIADLTDGWRLDLGGFEPPADAPDHWLLQIGADGRVRPLFGVPDGIELTAAAARGENRILAGNGWLVGEGGFLMTPAGERIPLDPPAGLAAATWYLHQIPGEAPRVRWLAGTAHSRVQAMAPTADGELWLCIDASGFESGLTVVLDPGGPTETAFAIIAPDDDPASDAVYARVDRDGRVRAAWMHDSYVSGGPRRCALSVVDGDLISVTHHSVTRRPGGGWRWTLADGDEVLLPAADDASGTTIARYDADGRPVWWQQHSEQFVRSPGWLATNGARLRDRIRVDDVDVGRRVTYDLADGSRTPAVGGGLGDGVLLADGRFAMVIDVRADTDTVGTYTDAPYTCPLGPDVPFCVVTLGPGARDGRLLP